MSDNIKIVPRISKVTKRTELFYYDERKDLVCYDFFEGHTTACYNYYLKNTQPIPPERITEANDLIKSYIGTDKYFVQSSKLK